MANLAQIRGTFNLDSLLYVTAPDNWDGNVGTWTLWTKYDKYVIVAESMDEGEMDDDNLHIPANYRIISVTNTYLG